METAEYKTLAEIREETENNPNAHKHFYRSFDYARAEALTRFIANLAATEPTFRIASMSPVMAVDRDAERPDDTRVFMVGLWCNYLVNDVCYYIQIDENPFFPAYFSKAVQVMRQPKSYYKPIPQRSTTGLVDVNEILYAGVQWENTEENINLLVKNIGKAMNHVKELSMKFHQDIPSYMNPFTKQAIYNH